jgi:hypothetical protein
MKFMHPLSFAPVSLVKKMEKYNYYQNGAVWRQENAGKFISIDCNFYLPISA